MSETLEAPAPTTAVTTAPVTSSPSEAAPAADTSVTTTVPETGSQTKSGTNPITAFKNFSAAELAEIQDGFRAKLHSNPRVGHDAALNVTQPKGDTLPIEEPVSQAEPTAPAESAVSAEETIPAETSAEPESSAEEETLVESNGKPPQQRLRAANPVDDLALTLYRKANFIGKPLSLGEAEIEAKRILGKSPDTLHAELVELRAKRKEARIGFDAEAIEAAETAVEDKLREIDRVERQELANQQAEELTAQNVQSQARGEAVALYPDLRNDGKDGRSESELHKAARVIHDRLVASGDPAVSAPDYHLDLARRAAKVTSTPPYLNGKTPPAKTVSRTVVPTAKPTIPLASGAARTTPTSQVSNLKAGIQKASPRQLESLQDKVRDLIERRQR